MNKYLKRTLIVSTIMIIIFVIIMVWPLPLRKVLRKEADTTAMTVSLSEHDTNVSSFSLSANSVEYRKIIEILEDYTYHCTWYSLFPMNLLPDMERIWLFIQGTAELLLMLIRDESSLTKEPQNIPIELIILDIMMQHSLQHK